MALRVRAFGRIPLAVLFFLFLLYLYDRSIVRQAVRDAKQRHQQDGAQGDIDKMLVVVATNATLHETSWVHEELPDWPSIIYVADDPTAAYHPPVNKGNEAMSYLTYILAHWERLPAVVVFAHHHAESFHIDPAFSSNAESIRRLNLSHVLAKGYQALRCRREVHCVTRTLEFHNRAKGLFREVWDAGFSAGVGRHGQPERCPELVLGPPFAQFAVSRAAIRRRPRRVYEDLREWLIRRKHPDPSVSDRNDAFQVGRAFEYMWHIIFGKPAFYCVDQDRCYCEAYGMCDEDPNRGWMPDANDPSQLKYGIDVKINDP